MDSPNTPSKWQHTYTNIFQQMIGRPGVRCVRAKDAICEKDAAIVHISGQARWNGIRYDIFDPFQLSVRDLDGSRANYKLIPDPASLKHYIIGGGEYAAVGFVGAYALTHADLIVLDESD